MNIQHVNKYTMSERKRLRISMPNPMQCHEFDSMPSFRNWLMTTDINLEKAEFSLWDASGMRKHLDDVNILCDKSIANSITIAWNEI